MNKDEERELLIAVALHDLEKKVIILELEKKWLLWIIRIVGTVGISQLFPESVDVLKGLLP